MSEGPRYVDRGGEIVIRQPLALGPTDMYSWVLPADPAALAAVCKRAFSDPSGGAIEYRPLLPMVAVVAAAIERGQSLDPVDRRKGWMPERDMGFWFPVARGTTRGDRFDIQQVAWYQPYLFVDNVAALVTGRETYGFHKQSAVCEMPAGPQEPSDFAVRTLVIERYGEDSEGKVAELYRVRRPEGAPVGPRKSVWHTAEQAFEELASELEALFADKVPVPVPSWALVRNLLKDALLGEVPMAFLKQFRDVADPAVACYQAIVEAPSRLTGWHGGGLLPPHEIDILPCDSHPIVTELGLGGQRSSAALGFWTRMSFVLENGRELWRAG